MNRYFKIVEIDADEFIKMTGEDLDGYQYVIPVDESVFVAIAEEAESEICVPLDCFDKGGE